MNILVYLSFVIAFGILLGLIEQYQVLERSANLVRRLSVGSPGSRALLCVVILIVEFATLEAGLRSVGGSEASPAFESLFMQDSRIGYRLKPNARTRYTTDEFSTDVAINAQGVRDDQNIGPKAPDERRIVVLGDSLVLAVQVPLAETFCKVLERRLDVADREHHWRVIDAGVQGYGPVEEWLFYQRVAAALAPDIVLVSSFVGDAPAAAAKETWIDAGGQPPSAAALITQTGIRRLLRSSMVLQITRLRVNQLRAHFSGPAPEAPLATYLADPPPDVRRGLDVTRRAIGLIATQAAAEGAQVAILLMPARFQTDDENYRQMDEAVKKAGGTFVRDAGTDRFRQALAPLGVPMFDPLPVLEAQPDRAGLFFQRNVHLTARGHQVVADALFQFLESNHMVAPTSH